jgi:hypothetical protein
MVLPEHGQKVDMDPQDPNGPLAMLSMLAVASANPLPFSLCETTADGKSTDMLNAATAREIVKI